MFVANERETLAEDRMGKGGERGLIDNLHPLQRVSADMIESSQAEPIRDSAAVGGRALRCPCFSPLAIYIHARTDLLRQERRKKKEESSAPQFIICFPFLSAADVLTGAGISHFNLAARICMSSSRVSLSINWFEIADLEDLKPIKSSGENVETALRKMQNVFAKFNLANTFCILRLLGPPQHLARAESPRCRNSQRFPVVLRRHRSLLRG